MTIERNVWGNRLNWLKPLLSKRRFLSSNLSSPAIFGWYYRVDRVLIRRRELALRLRRQPP